MPNDFLYGVRTRRVTSAGLDGLTPLLLLAYVLGMIAVGAYSHSQLSKLVEAGQPALSPSMLWTTVILGIVMLFAITGPMVLLGVFVTSKIMKFPMSGGAYLKACGVAALPALLLMLANLLPPNVALRLLVIIAIIPLSYFVMTKIYELGFVEGAVAFVVSAITGVIGLLIAGAIVGLVVVAGEVTKNRGPTAGIAALPGAVAPALPPVPPPRVTTPGTAKPAKSPADVFRDVLTARAAQNPDTSREAQEKEVASLKAEAERAGAIGRADVLNMLQDLEKRAAAAPSEQPEPSLFQEPAAAVLAAWRPSEAQLGALDPQEVSFESFNLRIPRDYRADLAASSAAEKTLSFTSNRPDAGKLVLRFVPAANAKQRRPWVTRQTFQAAAAERDKLFTIDGAGAATVEEGKVGNLAFTRVVHELGKRWGMHGKSAQYVARTSEGWIVIDAIAPSSTATTLDVLESSARTLRTRPAGDPMNDPLGAPALVARIAEDPDRVAQLLRLRGKEAEDLVIPQLKHADARSARAAATVLGDIGTEKSLPALQEAARSSDSFLAGAAREAIKKLKPDTLDAVAEALLDLEGGGDTHRKRAALDKLAQIKPAADDPRREKVATVLEAQMLGPDAFFVADHAAPALAAWAGKQTVPRLLPILADERTDMHQRRAVMAVFAKLKDERTVFPVVRWIIKDADTATKTLIEMGPVAELEVMKLLKERDASVRTAAARILQEIGTSKSTALLKRASLDQRDAGAAAAARVALDIVTERAKNAKAPPSTAP